METISERLYSAAFQGLFFFTAQSAKKEAFYAFPSQPGYATIGSADRKGCAFAYVWLSVVWLPV